MRTFHIHKRRILSYLSWPLFGLAATLGLTYYLTPDFGLLRDTVWLSLFSFLVLFWSVPTIILLVNHYRYFKGAVLSYDEQREEFCFVKEDRTLKFSKGNIVRVTQYNARTGQIPWSGIYIWKVETNDATVTLAPIVISKSDVEGIFSGPPWEAKHQFFVSI